MATLESTYYQICVISFHCNSCYVEMIFIVLRFGRCHRIRLNKTFQSKVTHNDKFDQNLLDHLYGYHLIMLSTDIMLVTSCTWPAKLKLKPLLFYLLVHAENLLTTPRSAMHLSPNPQLSEA